MSRMGSIARPLRVAILVAGSMAAGMWIQQEFNIIHSFTECFKSTSLLQKNDNDNENKVSKDEAVTIHNVEKAYGLPVHQNIISHDGYIVGYNYHLRQSVWSVEVLTSDDVSNRKDVIRQKCSFSRDPNIPKMFSSKSSDYSGSGFERGHLAAAANHRKSQEAMCSTFYLTNVSPQVGKGFNQRIWNHLEHHCRLEVKRYKHAVIVTGPLFISQNATDHGDKSSQKMNEGSSEILEQKFVRFKVMGDSEILVPTHFFKVFLGVSSDGRFESQSYIIRNENIPDDVELITQLVSMEMIEKLAGIHLFDRIPRNKIIPIQPKIKKFVESYVKKSLNN